MNYDQLVAEIEANHPFSLARYGDGEWLAIFGKTVVDKHGREVPGHNCDGHTYFPELGERLREVLKSRPRYHLGMQNRAMRLMGDEIRAFLAESGIEDLTWINADILHGASSEGRLEALFAALRLRPVLMVAPAYLRPIEERFPVEAWVEVPEKNCFLSVDALEARAVAYLDERRQRGLEGPVYVCIVASMAANLLVDSLYARYGTKHWFVDTGSLLDPYVGRNTRAYHKQLRL